MKKFLIFLISSLFIFQIACNPGTPVDPGPTPTPDPVTTGFPSDFPQLQDTGGSGSGTALTGFGGNTALNQAGNRAAVRRNPVILLHGNGGSADNVTWGWQTFRGYLKAAGYNDSEIWAVSYLGKDNAAADLSDPHKNNIDDVRRFIDAIITYLGVQKVDIVGHSLGCGMAVGYLKGLQNSGTWDHSDNRADKIGTIVTLAGANYGLGPYSLSEFQTGCAHEINSHKFLGVIDDTPYGPTTNQQTVPSDGSAWKKQSSLDNGTIVYVAVTATGDFVDGQAKDTGRLEGANLNIRFDLGGGLAGHEAIIKNQSVFNKISTYLNQTAVVEPNPPVVTINPSNGTEFIGSATINISATNDPDTVEYRIRVNGGTWSAWKTYSGVFTVSDQTVDIEAKASNQYGNSPVVSVSYTKSSIPPYEEANDTATGHYLAKRVDLNTFISLGGKYGYDVKFALYKFEGTNVWTDQMPQ